MVKLMIDQNNRSMEKDQSDTSKSVSIGLKTPDLNKQSYKKDEEGSLENSESLISDKEM